MKIYFLKEAEKEFDESTQYYESCQRGLGFAFSEEVFAALSRIKKFPDAWSKYHLNTRRCLVSRFPFGIVYRKRKGVIEILAVMHLNREPSFWLERLLKE
jgi:hypothetical protein